jgi:hypothetical protein
MQVLSHAKHLRSNSNIPEPSTRVHVNLRSTRNRRHLYEINNKQMINPRDN